MIEEDNDFDKEEEYDHLSNHHNFNQIEELKAKIQDHKESNTNLKIKAIKTDQSIKSNNNNQERQIQNTHNTIQEEEKEPEEPAIRIAILGDERSGKSSLIHCFLKEKIENSKDKYMIHLRAKRYIINNTEVNIILEELNINKDKYLLQPFIKKCDILFLCYALDEDEGDFNPKKIDKLFTSIKAYMEDDPKPIYIVGTKLDLVTELIQKRCYVYFDGEDLTSFGCKVRMYVQEKNEYQNNCFKVRKYYMTSSLLNINVDSLFLDAMRECYYEYEEQLREDYVNNNVDSNIRKKNCILF